MSLTGTLYDVYYMDNNGEQQCVCYFAANIYEAERLFISEQCVGEEIIKIVKNK